MNKFNTSVIFSIQRSGTTFLDHKLNGMFGNIWKTTPREGGEPLSIEFFQKHNIEDYYLPVAQLQAECTQSNFKILLNKYEHGERGFKLNRQFLNEWCERSNYPCFNIMANQILQRPEYLEGCDKPIIFLIRKNQWRRAMSSWVMENTELPSHIHESFDQPIEIIMNKQSVIDQCECSVRLVLKFKESVQHMPNVKFLYYENICRKEYWTNNFIQEMENFMGLNFCDKDFWPKLLPTRRAVKILNSDELKDQRLVDKYWIGE